VPEHLWAVEPGAYARNPPSIELPEHLLVARRPTTGHDAEGVGERLPR
jgi:hypothetical protein